ncbi:hypothetical protein [Paenibacillus wynnii]|uniref:Uncharacterized protein n=1 Tax=Paenibacillus wynnii TaxID=268407 RepID=A0A098M451_9BACL|nr:hypothetical protein [Paenibacillus wynnii]KGE16803.1 hypothetical protein PWYN_19105 [Paenibacillus wynnii]
MNSIQNKNIFVTYPHGKKYPYTFSIFLLANGLFIVFSDLYNLNLIYYLLFVIAFLPFLFISLKSQKIKYRLEFSDDFLLIGETSLSSESIKKIVIYKPISIYLHVASNENRKKRITLQMDKGNAEDAFTQIKEWTDKHNIPLENNY